MMKSATWNLSLVSAALVTLDIRIGSSSVSSMGPRSCRQSSAARRPTSRPPWILMGPRPGRYCSLLACCFFVGVRCPLIMSRKSQLRSHMPHQPGSSSGALPTADGSLGTAQDFEEHKLRKTGSPILNQSRTKAKLADTKLEEIATLTQKVLELEDLSPVCSKTCLCSAACEHHSETCCQGHSQ